MSDMFGSFETEKKNTPNNIEKRKHIPVEKHPEVADSYTPYQDEKGNLVWYQGEAIGINFEFEGLVKEKDVQRNKHGGRWGYVKDFLVGKLIIIELLNSRHDLVYVNKFIKKDNDAITFSLSEEESAKIIRGSYTLKINIESAPETTGGLSKNIMTADNMILVK